MLTLFAPRFDMGHSDDMLSRLAVPDAFCHDLRLSLAFILGVKHALHGEAPQPKTVDAQTLTLQELAYRTGFTTGWVYLHQHEGWASSKSRPVATGRSNS